MAQPNTDSNSINDDSSWKNQSQNNESIFDEYEKFLETIDDDLKMFVEDDYDIIKQAIDKDIRLIEEQIIKFPEPDFSDLKPLIKVDDEDDEAAIKPFIDNDEDEKVAEQEIKAETLWISSRLKPNETDLNYPMTSARRGLALIFTDCNFEKKIKAKLTESKIRFKTYLSDELQFQVEEFFLDSKKQIVQELSRIKDRDDADGDCVLIAILSRGFRDENGREFLYCGNDLTETLDLWTVLEATSCAILADKPKIFLQLGWDYEVDDSSVKDDSVRLMKSMSIYDVPDPSAYRIPNMCDFFVISAITKYENYNTFEEEMVTNFMEVFVDVMKENGYNWDLTMIMTEICYRITEMANRGNKRRDTVALRAPNYTSTLTSQLIFQKKCKTDAC